MMSLLSRVEKSFIARWTICLGLALVLVLSLCACPAWAGSYIATYSGGSVTMISNGSTATTTPYAPNTTTGKYGYQTGYVQWGTGAGPNGTTVAKSGSMQAQGTITTTFKWCGYPSGCGYPGSGGGYPGSGTPEDPPSAVVIAETCDTNWTGSGDPVKAIGSSNNGLTFAEVVSTPPAVGGSSSGTYYRIKQDPGTSFTLTCSPSATVSGTGAVGQPAVTGNGYAHVGYSASAAPLEVILSGGIGENNTKKYLIGQRVGANLLTGGLTASSYAWSVSNGVSPFKNYTPSTNSGVFEHFGVGGNDTRNPTAFYFAKPPGTGGADGNTAVICSAHLNVPTGSKPAAGFDVTPSRQCFVQAPPNTLSYNIGMPTGIRERDKLPIEGQTPLGIQLLGAFSNATGATVSSGIIWTGTVQTPAAYGTSGSPGWNFTQRIKPGRTLTEPTIPHTWVPNTAYLLDGSFWYAPALPNLYPADNTLHQDADRPSQGFGFPFFPMTTATVLENYDTYTMYRPPGTDSVFVPLKKLTWFWQATATATATPNDGDQWVITNKDAKVPSIYNFPPHPEWQGNVDSATWNPPLPLP